MTTVERSLRLQANQGTALNRATGQAGEIFYDVTNKTLRIYDGRTNTGSILATQTWVNSNTINSSELTTILNSYATTSSLSSYATTASLSSYATTASLSSYATTASLSSYATTVSPGFTGTLTAANVTISGKTKLGSTTERIVPYDQGVLGDITHEWNPSADTGAIIYLTNLSGDPFTINFIGLPLTTFNQAITIVITIEQPQGGTAQLPSIQFDSTDIFYLSPNAQLLSPSADFLDVLSLTILPVQTATFGDASIGTNIVVLATLNGYGYV